jgi:hypothetical protein
MKAFDVRLNGNRLCVAGIGEDGVMTTVINHVIGHGHDELSLRVGGLLSPIEEHVTWKRLSLEVGDKVEVRIIEAEAIDRPKERFRGDSKQDERNSRAYAKALAKKYGWKIITRPKPSK